MPGFIIGIDDNETGVAPPATPVYTYTWTLNSLMNQNAQVDPLIYVKDTTLPDFGVENETGQGSSLKYKYAKGVIFNDIKITFYATSGLLTALEAMKAQVWTPDNGIMPAASYKSTSVIQQYCADDVTPSQYWTLNGSWIKGISHSNLTYTSSDVHNVIVILAYDWATVADGTSP